MGRRRHIYELHAAAVLAAMIIASVARADDDDDNKPDRRWRIDTEQLFGFLIGTDVGDVGDKEIQTETSGRFGKRTGSYSALSQSLGYEFVPMQNFRVEANVFGAHHSISGVDDFDDVHRASFQGFSLELRYRLIDRRTAPFGLAINAEPRWARIGDETGQRVNQFGVDFVLALDQELVPDRVVAAFNLFYQPQTTAFAQTATRVNESTVGVGGGLMFQTAPGFLIGGELRYLRNHDSLGLSSFAGEALFLGPNLFVRFNEHWRLTVAWSSQIAGRAVDAPGPLNLTDFSRHEMKFRVGYEF
jgi:hypothetical protein